MARANALQKTVLALMLFGWIVMLQLIYDVTKPAAPSGLSAGISPQAIRMFDMGFHSTAGSFLWVTTMTELLDFWSGKDHYIADVAFLNGVDPKLSYPYAFSVIALPVVPARLYPNAVVDAQAIGQRGIADADPDWRIPYYMAINYYLQLKDLKNALWYFNIAANTPGVPAYAERFSLNFGIEQKERDRVRGIWSTVYQSSNDPDTKTRAAAYVERLNDFDYLEAAAKTYKQKYGAYPKAPADLVAKGIIPAIPVDPFGFDFVINTDGTSGIDLTKLPSYIDPSTLQ